ncbi:ABC transporter substrate-binding protein [Limoniibacter endophyticus]|uniref:SsuA/THI5-like domain-containing protein n=1 Tax=Limoniibacter endophyticus TaxID=1565040 RepID=A0A8J3GFK7_9HYPH|nr:ABC transporter substrate-binding protein [Limoniibacter endophyticus]GHC67487.1 hypothetical protein GCM10010136_11580 [Limoniibacter endophyticus]
MTLLTMNRRKFLVGSQAMALGALLPGICSVANAQEPVDMTYLTPFGYIFGFSETLYGDTSGIFRKHGINITIEGGRGSSMAVQQVTAGNALVSRTGGTDMIKAYARDPSIVAIGEIHQRDIFFVISSEEKPISKPEDMVGKTIGIVSAAGATENLLDMMLVAKDLPKAEVRREVVGNAPAAFQLIKQGRIDGFIATNDTVFQLRAAKEPIIAWSTDDVARCPGQVYITSKAQLAEKKDEISRFFAAIYESIETMNATSDKTAVVDSILSKYQLSEASGPDKGVSVLQNTLNNFKRSFDVKLKSVEDAWTSAYDLMVKAELIPALEERNFYDDSARVQALG